MAPRARYSWYAVFLLLYTNSCCAIDITCGSSADTGNALMCESLFKIFENALLSNGSNLYKLKKLFHTNPPELASISYYMELESNWLNNSDIDDFEGSGTSGALPLCSCAGSSILNRTIYRYDVDNATIRLRYGWTTIGVYTFIHPALLNQLQIQLPFTIMRKATDGFPFLWDGHNRLPSTNLHLFIPTNNLSCIPCDSQLDGVMKTLTSLVSSILVCYNVLFNMHIAISFAQTGNLREPRIALRKPRFAGQTWWNRAIVFFCARRRQALSGAY